MIILEGPDGAGKTTLAHEICDRFDLEMGVRGVTDRKLLYTVTRRDTYTALAQAVRGDLAPDVWDRLYFSEMVYAPLVGRSCEFKPPEQYFIGSIIKAMACPVILCLPPWDAVVENAGKAEQMDGVIDNLRYIYEAYMQLKPLRALSLLYDYTMPEGNGDYRSHARIMTIIDNYIKNRRVRQW